MSDDRYFGGSVVSIVRIPRQRDRRTIEQATATVEDWLDAQTVDEPDLDVEVLDRVSELVLAGATEEQVAEQVLLARQAGWSWAPISMLLGVTREQAVARFAPSEV
jgi:hypothetical protein